VSSSRSRASTWIAWLAAAAAAIGVAGCDPDACVRNSDCASGLVCGAGVCVTPPADPGEGGVASDSGGTHGDGAVTPRDGGSDGDLASDAIAGGDASADDAEISTMDAMSSGGSEDGATDADGSADATAD